jgi:hypothetical protein
MNYSPPQPSLFSLPAAQFLPLIHEFWRQMLSFKPLKAYTKHLHCSLEDLSTLQAQLLNSPYQLPGAKLNLFFAASTVPITPLPEILHSLLLKAPLVCRVPEDLWHDYYGNFTDFLPELLKEALEVKYWPSADQAQTKFWLQQADSIKVHGQDQTIKQLQTWASNKHLVGYGHKASFIVCQPQLNDIPALVEDIQAFAQRGCLSPQVIYYLSTDNLPVFAQALAVELAKLDFDLSPGESYSKYHKLELACLEPTNQLFGQNLICSEKLDFASAQAFIWLKPLSDLSNLLIIEKQLKGRIGSIGTNLEPVLLSTFLKGNYRICPLGQMQKPTVFWQQEPTLWQTPTL